MDELRVPASIAPTHNQPIVQQPNFGLALVRIGAGALLLEEARRMHSGGVGGRLIEDCAHRIALAPEPLARLGQDVLLRFPEPAAWVWFGATAALGALYFVGALTRPASLGLVVLAVLRWSFGPPHEQLLAALYAACALGCGLSDAGRRLGVDLLLAGSLPVWLTWSRGKGAGGSKGARRGAAAPSD